MNGTTKVLLRDPAAMLLTTTREQLSWTAGVVREENQERIGRKQSLVLSRRERQVLYWLALGKSAAQIGIILDISVCTVRVHIRNLVHKLGASNIPNAVARGFLSGLLTSNAPDPDERAHAGTTHDADGRLRNRD